MEERLTNLYKEIEFLLNNAPIEDDCTDDQNAMYSDMANLKCSMEDAGFATTDSNEKILNKCPICGEELEFVELNQYSNVYRILKNGKVSKTKKFKRDEGSMECAFINCSNPNCDFHTDCDYDTVTTGQYNHIYIHENDIGQFMIDVD